jgi:two-component system cell cycle sensor histidine kinase/response regulator CckA
MLEPNNTACNLESKDASVPQATDPLWMRGIAHDFCNLIQTTRGTLELLQYDPRFEDVPRLTAAINGLDRMSELAMRLKTHFPLVPIPWSVLKRHIQDALVISLDARHIPWTLLDQPNLPTIQGDLHELERIFLNLSWNSRDAMPQGGHITICASLVENQELTSRDPEVASRSAWWLRIDFIDQGIGMTPDQLNHAFDPYFTTKAGERGVGLPTVRALVERHGGYIYAESTPGHGTTFHVYFPCRPAR